MPILTISGSPSAQSRSARLPGHVRAQLERVGESADDLDLRALPADALLGAQTAHPAIAEALARVEAAGVVILERAMQRQPDPGEVTDVRAHTARPSPWDVSAAAVRWAV